MLEISRLFQSTPKSPKGDFYPVKRLIFYTHSELRKSLPTVGLGAVKIGLTQQ